MLKALKARIIQGYRTGTFPKTEPVLPDRFAGRPVWDKALCTGCGKCVENCSVKAVVKNDGKVTVDTGKCIFCRDCEEKCSSGALKFSKEYRLGSMTRSNLLASDGIYEPERPTDREFLKFCGKSLKIRQISAGGCSACELDFNVLGTLAWDMGRFGIKVVASPRHADAVLVTGPVSLNMQTALQKTYDAMGDPKLVIACGACAISGGIYQTSDKVCAGAEKMLPVDLYVPGCPPHPATLLEALVRFIGRRQKENKA